MKKIAIVTPWPNQKSGIATFIYKLLPYLSKFYNIDIFYDNIINVGVNVQANKYGNLYPIYKLDELSKQYDEIIYHMGNNFLYHAVIYNYIKKIPGIVELHDYDLSGFYRLYSMCYSLPNENIDQIIDISKKIIVHNQWTRDQIKKKDTYVVPLPAFDIENINNNLLEKDNTFRLGCFGYINENKRPYVILEAVKRCIKQKKQMHVYFLGKSNIAKFKEIIKQNNMDDYVTVIENSSNDEYIKGLKKCDAFVNLRYPTSGESSLTLTEELKMGKPVLVSEINQYLEFPDKVCWKVPVNRFEIKTLEKMLIYLIEHKDVRIQLGKNAKEYADTVLNCDTISKMYFDII